jgi:hypothetical protein
MQRFRVQRSPSSYLALFALALQLALSFGHVHLVASAGAPAVATAQQTEPGSAPSGGVPDRDEPCAICAIISLSGALLVPDAPALVFAGAAHEAFFPEFIAPLVADSTRAPFQARAPPA